MASLIFGHSQDKVTAKSGLENSIIHDIGVTGYYYIAKGNSIEGIEAKE